MRVLVTLATVVLLILLLGCDDDAPAAIGVTAHDFEVESLQSANIKTTLKDLKGKAVLIDFWATWCGPCRQLSPYVEDVYEKYQSKGLQAMAITSEDRSAVQRFETRSPHKMPVYLDPNSVTMSNYHVSGLPRVVLIGKDGKILYQLEGFPAGEENAEMKKLDDAVSAAIAG